MEPKTTPPPPAASKIPPEFLAEFTSKMAEITRDQVDEKIKELHAKALAGQLNLGQTGKSAPVLKHQDFHDRFDDLKGKGAAFGQFLKAHLIAQKSGKPLGDVVKELEGAGKLDGFVAKALMESNFQDGGSTVKPEILADFIELLRSAMVLRDLGMGVLPMKTNELLWNRQNSPATAGYRGELIAIVASQLKTGMLKFQARELNVFTSISNNLLNDAGPLVDQMVRDDVIAVLALRIDLAGIRGTGANDTPTGLRFLCDQVNNIIPATQAGAEATFDEIGKDLAKLFRRVKGVNGIIRKPGILITPRVEEALETVSSTLGVYPFREQLEKGYIRGAPYRTTTQIPENGGGGANETEVYLVDFAEFFMGENEDILIESSREATFVDGNGATVNAFQQGVTAIKATARHDFGLRHVEKAAVLTACKWGASFG